MTKVMPVCCRTELAGWVLEAKEALTEDELACTYRLRYQGFVIDNRTVREAELSPYDRDHQWERDSYDGQEEALYLLATLSHPSGVAHNVGTVRLLPCHRRYTLGDSVFEGKPFRLPERHPGTGEAVRPEEIMEVTRFVANPTPVGKGLVALPQFFTIHAAMVSASRRGKRYLVAETRTHVYETFAGNGWSAWKIDESVQYRQHLPVYLIWMDVKVDNPVPLTTAELRR